MLLAIIDCLLIDPIEVNTVNVDVSVGLNEILMIVFTAVVAISTTVYTCLTWKLLSETRNMRKAQTEPRVIVRVALVENDRLDLVVHNVARGLAKEVRIEFDGDPTYFDTERPVDRFPVITNGLPYLEANQLLAFPLGSPTEQQLNRATEAPWTFRTYYKTEEGDPKEDVYVQDFSQFVGLVRRWSWI